MEVNYKNLTPEEKFGLLKGEDNRSNLIHWFKEAQRHKPQYPFFVVLVSKMDGIIFSGYPFDGESEEKTLERLTGKINTSAVNNLHFYMAVNVDEGLNKLSESEEEGDKELYLQIKRED